MNPEPGCERDRCDVHPHCVFCGGLMVEEPERVVCVACGTDARVTAAQREVVQS
jgi:hypothetical protein